MRSKSEREHAAKSENAKVRSVLTAQDAKLLNSRANASSLNYKNQQRYETPNGDRWLTVELTVERRGGNTDYTSAQGYVTLNPEGTMFDPVGLFQISLDGDGPFELANTPGASVPVHKSEAKAHEAVAEATDPNMGPLTVSSPAP